MHAAHASPIPNPCNGWVMRTSHGLRMYDMKMNRGQKEKIPMMNAGIVPRQNAMIFFENQKTEISKTHDTTIVKVIKVLLAFSSFSMRRNEKQLNTFRVRPETITERKKNKKSIFLNTDNINTGRLTRAAATRNLALRYRTYQRSNMA